MLAPLLLLMSCVAPNRSQVIANACDIRIGGAVLQMAKEYHFDYAENVADACDGDTRALMNLLRFTERTDGEASLDHGAVLLSLRHRFGVRQFSAISRRLGTHRKSEIDSLLDTTSKFHEETMELLKRKKY